MGGAKFRKRRKSKKPGSSSKSDGRTAAPAEPAPKELDLATLHWPVLNMPQEIMDLIFIDFEPGHLRDASLVNWAFNAAATPALYGTLSLGANSGPLPQIPRLLQTMMNRPDLGKPVRTVVIGKLDQKSTQFPSKYTPYFPVPLSPVNVSQAVELISQTGMAHQGCWIEYFKKGDAEAFLNAHSDSAP
ncbi:hypothetical protein BN1723_009617, partial [Verticillium longisporum]